ncbi:NADH dehydrogenase [ubiquinone] 1 beta subcomplex subunit 4 isoform X2 [Trichomycterus rosablanca]|uniref:NADH dehydrogenase [ubiquinone] 1 beta subcomplex subunit 4 isoform X2 n=1 Tax=Trichomycterus rosablanca TaxID=2290929 RepID=UPI002F35661B
MSITVLGVSRNMADYKEAPLATRPKTLDPAEYFNVSPEYRRAEEERASIRAQLKRQYQLQLNNPLRKELIVSRRETVSLWLTSVSSANGRRQGGPCPHPLDIRTYRGI